MDGVEDAQDTVVRLETLDQKHLPQVADLFREAFANKRCCGVFAVAESVAGMQKRYASYPAEKFQLGMVALRGDEVLGFCQMTTRKLPIYPSGAHHCEAGEMYIETIAVSDRARGQGIGGKLLRWSEEKARAEHMKKLTLEVFQGNRAIGLYERFGFKIVPPDGDCVDACCENVTVCCFFGRPYGWCHPKWGTHIMIKHLE
jgi:ribosomal protein S18 acetylase RimI-like enzyme